jgi:hypothetical protein
MYTGGDADWLFEDVGHSRDARKHMAQFCIGKLNMQEHQPEVFSVCCVLSVAK